MSVLRKEFVWELRQNSRGGAKIQKRHLGGRKRLFFVYNEDQNVDTKLLYEVRSGSWGLYLQMRLE